MAPQRLEKAPARILTGTEPQELLEMARHFARLFAEYERRTTSTRRPAGPLTSLFPTRFIFVLATIEATVRSSAS